MKIPNPHPAGTVQHQRWEMGAKGYRETGPEQRALDYIWSEGWYAQMGHRVVPHGPDHGDYRAGFEDGLEVGQRLAADDRSVRFLAQCALLREIQSKDTESPAERVAQALTCDDAYTTSDYWTEWLAAARTALNEEGQP